MTPINCRDRVLAALRFEEPDTVPYQLPIEDDVIERIDAHYGDPTWRERLQQHVGFVGMGSLGVVMDGPAVYADHFGTVWRVDKRPHHLERPALIEPDLTDSVDPSF